MSEIQKHEDTLFERISELIEQARRRIKTTVDTAMVYTYFSVGRYIVIDEQHGQQRAEYGKQKIKELSEKLTKRFGSGWSVETLKKCRFFFKTYSNTSIGSAVLTKFVPENSPVKLGLQRGPNYFKRLVYHCCVNQPLNLLLIVRILELQQYFGAFDCRFEKYIYLCKWYNRFLA